MNSQEIFEKLSGFHVFKDIIVSGMRRGYLERDEAFKLIKLLRDIVEDVSGGRARVTLRLINALEEMICNPGLLIRQSVKQRFCRKDVVLMP